MISELPFFMQSYGWRTRWFLDCLREWFSNEPKRDLMKHRLLSCLITNRRDRRIGSLEILRLKRALEASRLSRWEEMWSLFKTNNFLGVFGSRKNAATEKDGRRENRQIKGGGTTDQSPVFKKPRAVSYGRPSKFNHVTYEKFLVWIPTGEAFFFNQSCLTGTR